jgi:hypothetical protein
MENWIWARGKYVLRICGLYYSKNIRNLEESRKAEM